VQIYINYTGKQWGGLKVKSRENEIMRRWEDERMRRREYGKGMEIVE